MRFFSSAFLLASILWCGGAGAANPVPDYIGRHVSTPQDTQAINKVIEDFQVAIKTKDSKLLSTLVLNANILFDSPLGPEGIAMVRNKRDVNFDGIRAGAYSEFARFIGMAKESLEEKFYNVKITQDGNVAWVMFDYEFLENGKTQNYGVETWQMIKAADSQWKIVSVIWTMHPLPK